MMTTDLIARTGRVQNWIDNPESRLPVSCTVFVVEDEMEGPDGIEASWRFVSHALRNGAGCAVHLSKLRPTGADNGRGLVASGPVSFARIYSTLNETLRRGGVYKNGAVVCHLDLDHPDILEFIETPREQLPWIKRCVNLTWRTWLKASDEVQWALIEGIKRGDIWLNKIRFDGVGDRIYGNVCLEVYLPHRGTCLLQHVNLGACKTDKDIVRGFTEGMQSLCELHSKTGVGDTGEYLWPAEDRQVGLGLLGLANLLRMRGVTYRDFGKALQDLYVGNEFSDCSRVAWSLAQAFEQGIWDAAQIALKHKMKRAFAIAPTASCSYRYTDVDGYTTTPEIAPPIAREVDRDSATFGVESFNYGPVEVASDVGWDDYFRVVNMLVGLYQETGLFHGYSFNSWSDVVTYDEHFMTEWLDSEQTSLYYSLQVMGNTQDKSDVYAAIDKGTLKDYLNEILSDKEPACECGE
jgi:hypothetical protein